MNKRILISLSVIGAVAALAIGGTVAYFSDTETSTGNTFTAGSIDLKIDNTSYLLEDGEMVLNEGTTWAEKDLEGELFFNFADLKPGDLGEDTVSLHVHDNDAWACVTMNLTKNDDATENPNDIDCTEPELEDGDDCDDPVEPDQNLFDGDLAQELNFIFWVDDGDNVLEVDEEVLMAGPAINVLGGVTYTLADSGENNVGGENGDPLTGSHTYYIGKAWCFGNLVPAPLPQGTGGPDVRGPGVTCDGVGVDNMSQSDQVKGDIIFYAVQARNNPNFTCVSPQ